jgi:LCP family protein required for cell wall assembly
MANNSRNMRKRNSNRKQNQVNLVSARSGSNAETNKLSRLNAADGYSEIRKKRARKKKIAIGLSITLASLLIAVIAGGVAYALMANSFARDFAGNLTDFSTGDWKDALKEPEKPEDPFWVLLLGTDELSEPGFGRTDTIILARVDQANKKVALLSIPRDSLVDIPGHGKDKINAAYSYGEQESQGGGTPLTIRTVSEFTGVDIAYFAQVSIDGIAGLVDGVGGVTVDVPVDVEAHQDTGNVEILAGQQKLDGQKALVFIRSREYDSGDFQRQANQRTFLQALAKQILATRNPLEIASTVTNIANMTYTSMDPLKLVKVAQGMQGLQETDMYTYTVPSTIKEERSGGVLTGSWVIPDEEKLNELIEAINVGNYPPLQTGDELYASTKVPDGYVADSSGSQTATTDKVDPSKYTVDVRNGCGIDGSATSISDKLVLAGYVKGEIGNTDAYIYDDTLIIYKNANDRAVANDIRTKIGYGKVLASEGRYEFEGHMLVVVGNDFRG